MVRPTQCGICVENAQWIPEIFLSPRQVGREPGPRVRPLGVSCPRGDAQIVGRFAEGSTAEVTQAHEHGHPRVDRGQSVKGLVDREDVVIGVASGKAVQVDRHLSPRPTVACHAGAGVVNEDSPHGLGGGGEEVAAAIEQLISDEPQVGFVNQRGGVEGVAGGFGGHARGGELPELIVDERQQLSSGAAVAGLGGFEELGDLGHCGSSLLDTATPIAPPAADNRRVPGRPYGIASDCGPAEFGATRPNPSGGWSGHRERPRHIGPQWRV